MRAQVMISRTVALSGLVSLWPLYPTLQPHPSITKRRPSNAMRIHRPRSQSCMCMHLPQVASLSKFGGYSLLFLSNRTHPPLSKDEKHRQLIASAVLPPRPPPLVHPRTVKLGLPQLPIDVVVRPAQPLRKLVPARHLRLLPRHVALEVLGAHPARVQLGEEPDEAEQVRLLRPRRLLRVRRRDGVEERPGAASEGLDVGRAVGRRAGGGGRRGYGSAVGMGVGFGHLLGLRGP